MSASVRTAESIVVVVDVDVDVDVVDVDVVDVDEDDDDVVESGTDDADVATVVVSPVVFGLDEAELHAAAHTSSTSAPAAYLARRATASRFLAMGLLAVAPDLRSIRP